jgi:hypothetical protein
MMHNNDNDELYKFCINLSQSANPKLNNEIDSQIPKNKYAQPIITEKFNFTNYKTIINAFLINTTNIECFYTDIIFNNNENTILEILTNINETMNIKSTLQIKNSNYDIIEIFEFKYINHNNFRLELEADLCKNNKSSIVNLYKNILYMYNDPYVYIISNNKSTKYIGSHCVLKKNVCKLNNNNILVWKYIY